MCYVARCCGKKIFAAAEEDGVSEMCERWGCQGHSVTLRAFQISSFAIAHIVVVVASLLEALASSWAYIGIGIGINQPFFCLFTVALAVIWASIKVQILTRSKGAKVRKQLTTWGND